MEIVSNDEIKRGIETPKLIEIAHHTHLAWCEELDRQKVGWGARYLPFELVHGSKHYENDLRIRVAAILAVIKELGVAPSALQPITGQPLVFPAEINRGIKSRYLFKLMSIANDAWDEESDRRDDEVFPHESFKNKFIGQARRLYVASQLSVLKAVPMSLNEKPSRDKIQKMSLSEYRQTMERFGNHCAVCGRVGQPVVQSLEGRGYYYCEDTKTCQAHHG